MTRNTQSSRKLSLGMVLFLSVATAAHGRSPDLEISPETIPVNYSTYQVNKGLPAPAGTGVRYSINRDWFVFGESYRPSPSAQSQKSRLLISEETRIILIGGGIYF